MELWVYVNNAAIYFPSSKESTKVLDISMKDIMEILNVNAISPGIIETQMGMEIYSTKEKLRERIEQNLIKRACTPEALAYLGKYLLSEHAGYITGESLDLSGGSLIK